MPIGRRQFIGVLAGAAAGTAIGYPAGHAFNNVLASADQPIYPPRGPEQHILSVCNACPGGCGVRARRIGERVVKLEGNPLHPISGGRLCAKGQAALQTLYHPDRVRVPLRRTGPRGALSSFEPSTWERALSDIASHLRALRDEQRPEALVLLRGAGTGMAARLASGFVAAFGSPNDIVLDRGNDASAQALAVTQGVHATPVYDIRAAEYVLSLGSEILEVGASPVYTTRAYGDFRQRRSERRGKLVHVDPRLSITAASADEWIPIRPGTHATFAFGIAAAIVSEGLYDRSFVLEHCNGFEDGPEGGLRALLLSRFPLDKVAGDTGVSVNVILRIAREISGSRRGVVIGPHKGPLLSARLYDHLAAHILNALLGNIDQPGGVLVPEEVPVAQWPATDGAAEKARREKPRLDGAQSGAASGDPEQLGIALATGQPYRADVLMLLDADPLFASAAEPRFAEGLEHVPLVVSFALIPSDTALHSDWILPETHFLEQWDLHTSPAGVAFPVASVASLALTRPVGQARPPGDVFLDLARRAGLERAFPWSDSHAVMLSDIDALYAARRGAVIGTAFDEAWARMMEDAGWWAPSYASAEELWTKSQEAGGWWDPFYDHGDWARVLRTHSGQFEMRPDLVRQLADANAPPQASGASLALLLFEPAVIAGGKGAELPFLQALLDPGHEERWETWGEIHPHTARALGIAEGASLRVASSRASIVVRAKVTERVVPGAIGIPVGLGRVAGGRWAAGIGSNPLRLLTGAREPVSSLPDHGAATVLVTEATAREARAARS